MPTTLLTTPITQLVSNLEKIMFILQKTIEEKIYVTPQNIQDIICCYNSEA